MLVPSIFSSDLFDNFFNNGFTPTKSLIQSSDSLNLMNTDIKEYEDKYELDIDLPGYKKEDVKASLKDGYLTVEAERHADNEIKDKNGKYIRKECFSGKSQRSFYVGDQITQEDITAAFENGILALSIPKKKSIPKVDETHYIAIQ